MRIFENIDCTEGMEKYKDILTSRKVLAIVDPPYGIGESNNGRNESLGSTSKWKGRDKCKTYTRKDWDASPPTKEYFNELMRTSKNQVIWGGNYFVEHLTAKMGWIFWNKKTGDSDYSDGELAWTSFNRALRTFDWLWNGFRQQQPEPRIHPTQKPIALYKWLLENYSKDHDLILDTHVGSASSLIACEEFGIDYIGFELDEDYYKDAKNRLEKARFIRENKTAKECYVNDLALFKDAI